MHGKALFLLRLADSLCSHFSQPSLHFLNLHRHPEFAPLVQNPALLPPTWRGMLYIQRLELKATPYKAVYARSSRVQAEKTYQLSFYVEGIRFTQEGAYPIATTLPLPSQEWYSTLLNQLYELFLSRL